MASPVSLIKEDDCKSKSVNFTCLIVPCWAYRFLEKVKIKSSRKADLRDSLFISTNWFVKLLNKQHEQIVLIYRFVVQFLMNDFTSFR